MLYGVARDNDATEQLNLVDLAYNHRSKMARAVRAWISRNALPIGGIAVSLLLLVALGVLIAVAPGALPRGGPTLAVAACCVWLQVLQHLKWQWDRRRSSQETSRILQGQADLRSLITVQQTRAVQVQTQVALLRAEMHALLGKLPDGVVSYADRRAIEVTLDAVQKLADTGTDGSAPPEGATVTHITTRQRQN